MVLSIERKYCLAGLCNYIRVSNFHHTFQSYCKSHRLMGPHLQLAYKKNAVRSQIFFSSKEISFYSLHVTLQNLSQTEHLKHILI